MTTEWRTTTEVPAIRVTPRPSNVWFKNLYSLTPTYHGWPVGRDYTGKTFCGQPMDDEVRHRPMGVMLRIEHAERIGRPCRNCWPVV